MNTIENQIEVLQAFKDGKAVEVLCNNGEWKQIEEEVTDFYPFNFATETYRVKPATRRYKNAEEFMHAQMEHGMWLTQKWSKEYHHQPIFINNDKITLHTGAKIENYDFEELLMYFIWQDGTPCGIEQ